MQASKEGSAKSPGVEEKEAKFMAALQRMVGGSMEGPAVGLHCAGKGAQRAIINK